MQNHLGLIQQIVKGNQQAFKEIYDIFHVKVFNTAMGYIQNNEEAEEVTQDVFVEIFRSAHKFKGNALVSTWIYRITVNKCLDFLRYKQRKKRAVWLKRFLGFSDNEQERDIPDFVHPGILLEQKENAQLLFKVIDTLAEKQKTAFILTYVEDLPQKEVAEIMEISVKAVESLLQRAKTNLRKKLDKYNPNRRK